MMIVGWMDLKHFLLTKDGSSCTSTSPFMAFRTVSTLHSIFVGSNKSLSWKLVCCMACGLVVLINQRCHYSPHTSINTFMTGFSPVIRRWQTYLSIKGLTNPSPPRRTVFPNSCWLRGFRIAHGKKAPSLSQKAASSNKFCWRDLQALSSPPPAKYPRPADLISP